MKIGYFDASYGVSGDMIVGSLLDAGLPLSALQKELEKISLLSGYTILEREEQRRDPRIGHERRAKRFLVKTQKEKGVRSLREIRLLLTKSKLAAADKEKVLAIFRRLSEAERKVHGKTFDHFHQIGEADSIIDIVSAVCGLRILGVAKVYSSTVNLGSPAPATALILKGLPVRIDANLPECTTPTGAAILAEMAEFVPPPPFYLIATGAGAGSRTVPEPNLLSFFLGETFAPEDTDEVLVMETNIDDMPPYAYETVFQKLQEAGCLDFILTPGLMKKSRPGQKLEVILKRENLNTLLGVIFEYTSTLGIRIRPASRIVLQREIEEVKVRGHRVRIKTGSFRGKVVKITPEYEDIKAIAEKDGVSLKEITEEAKTALFQKWGR